MSLRGELRRLKVVRGGDDGGGGGSSACTVCLENPREVMLTACGHVCLCSDCADR